MITEIEDEEYGANERVYNSIEFNEWQEENPIRFGKLIKKYPNIKLLCPKDRDRSRGCISTRGIILCRITSRRGNKG